MAVGIFVCPALCGCELRITGEWAHPPDADGKYHAFPIRKPIPGKPSSVRSIEIVSVCPTHAQWQTDPLPADPYGGAAGYYDIPAAPTPEEKLFIRFYRYVGASSTLFCRCKTGVVVDRETGVASHLVHPQHSQRCKDHADDTDHAKAIGLHRVYADAVNALAVVDPEARLVHVIATGALELSVIGVTTDRARAVQAVERAVNGRAAVR